MACHLVKAGYTVIGLDTSPEPPPPWSKRGQGAESIEQAVKDAMWWRSWCRTPPSAERPAGDDGVFAHAQPGTLVIDLSSIRPDVTGSSAKIGAERGLRIIDAPCPCVSPAPRNATLSTWLAV